MELNIFINLDISFCVINAIQDRRPGNRGLISGKSQIFLRVLKRLRQESFPRSLLFDIS